MNEAFKGLAQLLLILLACFIVIALATDVGNHWLRENLPEDYVDMLPLKEDKELEIELETLPKEERSAVPIEWPDDNTDSDKNLNIEKNIFYYKEAHLNNIGECAASCRGGYAYYFATMSCHCQPQ